MDSNLRCKECVSPQFPWTEKSVDRSDARGVANAQAKTRATARKLADQLVRPGGALQQAGNAGVWVAVQNRGEDDPDQYWIGRAVRVVNTFTDIGTVAGTGGRVRYDKGDHEVC